MPKRNRPDNAEYYVNGRTEHVAQGDIFRDVPFPMALPEPPPREESIGMGTRRVLETPFFMHAHGVLISHSSGFMAQPVGTRGYAHPYRVLVPVLPIAMLQEQEVLNDDLLRLLRREDKLSNFMFLPPRPGLFGAEHAACLYRPALVHMDLLEGRRLIQMSEVGVQQLQAKIVEAFTGEWIEPAQFSPTMADHWNP
jgi:hypothetical protein